MSLGAKWRSSIDYNGEKNAPGMKDIILLWDGGCQGSSQEGNSGIERGMLFREVSSGRQSLPDRRNSLRLGGGMGCTHLGISMSTGGPGLDREWKPGEGDRSQFIWGLECRERLWNLPERQREAIEGLGTANGVTRAVLLKEILFGSGTSPVFWSVRPGSPAWGLF